MGGSSPHALRTHLLHVACALALAVALHPASAAEFEVDATGIPALDVRRVQSAVDAAVAAGDSTVRLRGHFRFGTCFGCVTVRGAVTIEGAGDRPTVIEGGNLGAIVVRETPGLPANSVIRIANVHFKGASAAAVGVGQLFSRFEFVGNQVTDVIGVLRAQGGFFRAGVGLIVAAAGLPLGELTGDALIQGNYIDTPGSGFDGFLVGDDNGVAAAGAQCRLSRIAILDNFIRTKGEGIEVEGCVNQEGRILIKRNVVITNSAFSLFLDNLATPGEFPFRKGGHPAAVKPFGNDYASVRVIDNDIVVRAGFGGRSAVCMLLGGVDPDAETLVRGNVCWMDRIYAGILGGWAGAPPTFFPPAALSGARIKHNRFIGTAFFGIAFMDFDFPVPDFALTNDAHDNVMRANDLSLFRPGKASLYFGPSTHDNLFVGDPHGPVIDRGTNNVVDPF